MMGNFLQKHRRVWMGITFLWGLFQALPLWAGPPFETDDPEPVEYHHWEIFFAASYSRTIS